MLNRLTSPRFLRLLAIMIVALLPLTGCMTYPVNPPLDQVDQKDGYSFNGLLDNGAMLNENFVVLSFSGGGSRAAAFAYGVMEGLQETDVGGGKTLLDELKVITSVSGGSYTAAYYSLFGKEKFFSDFRDEVLHLKISSGIMRHIMMPWNWSWIFSPWVGRSDIAHEYLDKKIFKNHTFADMPRKWPFLVINSTDMTQGNWFTFNQGFFDLLCSDMNQIKISRAVMASSAFPGAFTPITLKNYPKSQCGFERWPLVDNALATAFDRDPQLYNRARTFRSYEDHEARPYIHLFDGGVADNLGLRSVVAAVQLGAWPIFSKEHFVAPMKNLIVIAVDAMPEADLSMDKTSRPPRLVKILHKAATNPLTNYSIDTIMSLWSNMVHNKSMGANYAEFQQLCDEVSCKGDSEECVKEREGCYLRAQFPSIVRPPYPNMYILHLRFDQIKDPGLRDRVANIKTDLKLPKEEIELLVKSGKALLKQSIYYEDMVKAVREAGSS